MNKIIEMRQKRAALIRQARHLLDAADEAERTLTAEEEQEYDRIVAEADDLGRSILREEELRQRELSLVNAELGIEDPDGGRSLNPRDAQGEVRDQVNELQERYARAFESYVRYGREGMEADDWRTLRLGYVDMKGRTSFGDVEFEQRDQAKGAGATGGYVVPAEFQATLVEYLIQAGTARDIGTTQIVTGAGEDLTLPKLTAHGAASWVGEAGAITATDETFGTVTLKAYKAVRLVKTSVELLEDSAVDLETLLGRAIGQSIGALENAAYFVGDGSGKPTGMLAASGGVTTYKTLASATAITADELIEAKFTLPIAYRRNARWVIHDSAVLAISKLKDNDGQYIWRTGLQAGEPDVLLGHPVSIDPDLQAFGVASNKFGIFGDFGAYWIRDVGRVGPRRTSSTADVGAFAVRRLDERFADNLQVGFLAYHRTDGMLLDPNAMVGLRMAAS
jgi:HK97 family phage major capsid protein